MTEPVTISFADFLVKLGDGNTPEVFAAPCGFTKKSIKRNAASSDTIVPDCQNPAQAAWLKRNIVSLSIEVSGSGVLAMEDLATWRAWWESGASKDVQIIWDLTLAQGGGMYTGAMVITDHSDDVDLKSEAGLAQFSITLQSDGPMVWSNASA